MAKKPTDVEAFLTGLRHPFKQGVEDLRAAILKSNAALTEHIKWNAPSFCHRSEDRVTFRLPPKGDALQLIFHRGAKAKAAGDFKFEDPSGLVEWAAVDRGVVTLKALSEVKAKKKAIVALVNAWVRATDEGADS